MSVRPSSQAKPSSLNEGMNLEKDEEMTIESDRAVQKLSASQGVTSTPFVQRLALQSEDRNRSHVDPILEKELNGKHNRMELDQFLERYTRSAAYDEGSEVHEGLCKMADEVGADLKGCVAESMIYPHWLKLLNHMLDIARQANNDVGAEHLRFVDSSKMRLKFGAGVRQPDILAITNADEGKNLRWSDVLLVVEGKMSRERQTDGSGSNPSKSTSTQSRTRLPSWGSDVFSPSEPRVTPTSAQASVIQQSHNDVQADELQLASYANCIYTTLGNRVFVLGMLLRGDFFQLWRYDCTGATSTPLTKLTRPNVAYLARFVGNLLSPPAQLGFLPQILPPEGDAPTLRYPPRSLQGWRVIIPSCYGVQSSCHGVLGMSLCDRHSLIGRGTVVYEISLRGWKGDGDLVIKFSWHPVSRMSESDIIEHARKHGVNRHIPLVLLAGVLLIDDPPLRDSGVELRFLVIRKIFPLNEMKGADASYLYRIIVQLMCVVHVLFWKAQTLHRDISFNNVGWERDEEGNPSAMLIDFDRAIIEEGQDPSSPARTGTVAFMALDFLSNSKIRHQLHHDQESLFWVFVWLCANNKRTVNPREGNLVAKWCNHDWSVIRRAKKDFLEATISATSLVPEHAENYLLLLEYREYVQKCLRARQDTREALSGKMGWGIFSEARKAGKPAPEALAMVEERINEADAEFISKAGDSGLHLEGVGSVFIKYLEEEDHWDKVNCYETLEAGKRLKFKDSPYTPKAVM